MWSQAALQVNFLPETPAQVEALLSCSCPWSCQIQNGSRCQNDSKWTLFRISDSSLLWCFGFDEAVPPPAKKAKVVQTSGAPQLILVFARYLRRPEVPEGAFLKLRSDHLRSDPSGFSIFSIGFSP